MAEYVTYEQASVILGCHVSNMPKLVRKGQLKALHRRGASFDQHEVRALAKRRHDEREAQRTPRPKQVIDRRPDSEHEWLSINHVAEMLGEPPRQVRRLHLLGRLESCQVRRRGTRSKTRTDTKTPRSKRTIPLPDVAGEALSTHLAKFPTGDDGSLFVGRQGTPWRTDYYGAQLFNKAVLKAGLPEHITPHDLRHFYASQLLAAGESVVTVADGLGHANATTVLKTYAHLVPGGDDRTRRAIDAAWGGSASSSEGVSD